MFLHELTNQYHTNQIAEFVNLLREFINCELQLYIGNTHLRSWADEETRLRVNEIALKLRAPPWNLTVRDLDKICDHAQSLLNEINEIHGY